MTTPPPANAPSDFRQHRPREPTKLLGMTTFTIHPLPESVLADVRSMRPGAAVIAEGGEPVRCCLRDAALGDELLLVNYEPPLPESPYREKGAVYVHARPCEEPPVQSVYPPDWRQRPQVLRAYDARGWIHDATTVHDGTDPERALRDVLAQPGVVQVHSRNVAYGCYMFTATRG
jgi:hypothetical protein